MIDKGPLKPKKKAGSALGGFKAKGKYGNVNGALSVKRDKLPVLNRPKRGKLIGGTGLSGVKLPKPPTDYTLPQNRGLVKANTPERKAAVASELAKLNANTNLTGTQKSHRSDLLKEQKRRGWA